MSETDDTLNDVQLDDPVGGAGKAAPIAADQLARLHLVGAGLTRAASADEVIQIVVRQGMAALDARGAVLALVGDDGRLTLVGTMGYDLGVVARFEGSPLDTPLPITDAIRMGSAVWLSSAAETMERYPGLPMGATAEASASLPLHVGDTVFGALGVSFEAAHQFSEADRLFLRALADECALALDRLRLLDVVSASGRRPQDGGPTAAQLRLAIDAARIGTFDWDLATNEVRWNEHHAELFGFPPDEVGTTERFLSHVSPEDRESLTEKFRQGVLSGDMVEHQFRVVRPDGSSRWVIARGQALYADDDRAERVTGVVLDRTETVSLADRMVRTLESIADAFLAVDRSWRFTYVNAEAERLLRRRREDVLGQSLWDAFPGAVGSEFEHAYRRAVDTGDPVTFEAYFTPLDIWVEVRAYPSPDGLSVYFHDVTERRQLDVQRAAVLEAESRARDAADRVLRLAAGLGGDLGAREVAARVCRGVVEAFGCSRAAVWGIDGDEATLTACYPDDRAIAPGETLEPDPDALVPLRTGRPTFVSDIRRDGSPMQRADSERLDTRSVLQVPLTLTDATDALLTLAWDHVVTAEEVPVLSVADRLADQVSLALEQARRREAQAEVVRLNGRLQAGLLPSFSVQATDVQVASSYRAGEHRLLLGGDFFDVLELPSGEIGVLMGDVTGHGPDAAALGTMLRAAWRGLALHGATATDVVRALDAVLRAERATEEAFATLGCLWIAPDRSAASVVLAGHPSPVLLDARGATTLAAPHGLALGVLPEGPDDYAGAVVKLDAPWAILAYTDGLIEARIAPGSPERFGVDRLIERVGRGDPRRIDGAFLHDLLAEVEEQSGEPFADDVAVVAVSHGGSAPGHPT